MRYDFSSHFLRVNPPDSTFPQAWESLCALLLGAEFGTAGLVRLGPPDCGVDILARQQRRAYQCKSTRSGATGTIKANEAAKSLVKAYGVRDTLSWSCYAYATNAYFSGVSVRKILSHARELGLGTDELEFLGPDYWDRLCTTHSSLVEDRFDYRVSASDNRILESIKAMGEHPNLDALIDKLIEAEISLMFTNNLTELKLDMALRLDLTAEEYINAVLDLLNLPRASINFKDLDSSAAPRVSIKINGGEVESRAPLGDIGCKPEDVLDLVFSFDINRGLDASGLDDAYIYRQLGVTEITFVSGADVQLSNEGKASKRAVELYQTMIWSGATSLRVLAGVYAEAA